MTDKEYDGWCHHHAAAFALDNDAGLGMLLAWREAFSLAGYTADDLMDATNWMIGQQPPRFRSDHLALIRQRIAAQRLARLQANRSVQDQDESCHECGGSGFVLVPHPATVVDGEWVSTTGAALRRANVTCRCRAGARVQESHQRGKEKDRSFRPMLTLADYERRVPQWRDLLGDDARLAKAWERAMRASESNPVRRLAEKCRMPRDDKVPF